MKIYFLCTILLLSFSSFSKDICLTTLFAPAGEIKGLNDKMLTEFEINLSHFVIEDDLLKLYGPKNPEVVSNRFKERVLIAQHKLVKIDDTTYNLASNGHPVIENIAGDSKFWRFGFNFDFYKRYENRAYNSIMNYCINIKMRNDDDCEKFTRDIFHAYVSPVAIQGCIKL